MLQPRMSPITGSQTFKEERLREEFETSVTAKPPGLFFYLYFLIFTEDLFKCSYSVAILEIKGRV